MLREEAELMRIVDTVAATAEAFFSAYAELLDETATREFLRVLRGISRRR